MKEKSLFMNVLYLHFLFLMEYIDFYLTLVGFGWKDQRE